MENSHTGIEVRDAMTLRFTQLHPVFVAEAEGVDLRQPLTPHQAAEIEAAMDRFGVLVFRGQDIDDDQQLAFALNFGKLETETATVDVHKRRLKHAQMNDISNLDEHGRLLAADDRRRMFNLGNRLWHSDSSFKPTPAKYSLLHGRVIPPEGGETEFADMRAAWDALPDRTKAKLRDLVCDHSLLFSARSSASPSLPTRSGRSSHRFRSVSSAATRVPGASRSTSHPTSAASMAGPCRKPWR